MSRPTLSALLLLLILSGCAPMVPLIQDDPAAQKPLAIIETPEFELRLEHIDRAYQHNVFDLELINHSDTSYEFDVSEILYYGSNHPFETVDNRLHQKASRVSTMVPRMRFATDSADIMKLAWQAQRTAQVMRGVAVGLAVVAVAAQTNNNVQASRKREWSYADVNRYNRRHNTAVATYVAGSVLNHASIESGYRAGEDINYLPGELLTSGNIRPFEARRGKVFLKYSAEIKYWRIIVPVGNREYVFDFKTKNARGIAHPDTDRPFVDN